MNIEHKSRPAEGWKPYVYWDERNPKATEAANWLNIGRNSVEEANVILVLGGDGTMIKAIRELHHHTKPFYGVNFGHVGFLLNNPGVIPAHISVYSLPMLICEWDLPDPENNVGADIAVNDIWVERASPQSASLKIEVNDKVVIPKMYSDGVLVASPQGSTAYARAMGGTPMPLTTKAYQIVGNNVGFPNWKSAVLDLNQRVTVTNHDPAKRPLKLYADGVLLYEGVTKVRIGVCTHKSFQLIFDKDLNLGHKIAAVQFPQ